MKKCLEFAELVYLCMLYGYETIAELTAKFYTPASGIKHKIRVPFETEADDFYLEGIVPGVFASIVKLSESETTQSRGHMVKEHQKFEKVFHESATIPELGDFPYAMSVPIENGGWIDGVQPCWTGKAFFKDENSKEYIEWKKPLYNTYYKKGTGLVSEPILSRPHYGFNQDDCVICTTVWADGTPRRCEQSIADTYEAQVEACYKERGMLLNTLSKSKVTWASFSQEDIQNRMAPERVAKRQLNVARTKLADIKFARDLFQMNGNEVVLKKSKLAQSPNAIAILFGGTNIGEKFPKSDNVLTVKWAFKLLTKQQEEATKELQIAEAKAKLFA